MQIVWKYFYDVRSVREHDTMYQLRNLINRTNVTVKPTCDNFFNTLVTSHILVAPLDYLGMKSINDTPSTETIPSSETLWISSREEKSIELKEITTSVVGKFISLSFNKRPVTFTIDHVQQYSRNLLSIGCFYLEFQDAIREGDGKRVLRCWRYLLPIFHNSGHKNYAIEAFNLLCQYHYLLPAKQAEQLL